MSDCHACTGCNLITSSPARSADTAVFAIVGPPNSGKSTLFNRLTGMRQKVANFPGVTVEHRTGRARVGGRRSIDLVDLPGVYGLNPRSEDEQVTRDVLLGEMPGMPKPDGILLILDVNNLGRHLVLAAPILSLGLPTLIILNMADDLRRRGGDLEIDCLSQQLGAPVVLVSAAKGEGLDQIAHFLEGVCAGLPVRKAPLVELPVLNDIPKCRQWAASVGRGAGYQAPAPPLWTRRLDRVFLHPVIGPAVFALVVIGVFQTIFSGARPIMDALQEGIAASGAWVASVLPDSPFRDLLTEGVWNGVGSVIVFLPQILLLFLFIGILEDSGYLARAALIADRTMSKFGLQGKSFISLLSAYACAVPAIMATRTIENKRDRIATILIAPFMTCSARLPVYTLVIAAFIAPKYQVLALLSLYIIGFLAAIGTAKLLKSTILKGARSSFLLEMPPYRWPTPRSLGLRLVDRAKVFLRRAGTVILAVAIVIWVLGHLPLKNGAPPPIDQSIEAKIGHAVEPAIKPLGFNWKIGIGLISSLAAREVIVGTLGTIYGMEGSSEHSVELQRALRRDLTPGGAAALLVFFAFAMQCMSTIAVVRRETMSWKWPALQFAYMTLFAYAAAFAANHAVLWLA